MQFFTTLSVAAIIALAAAVPVADEPANTRPFDIELPADLPTASDGPVFLIEGEGASKRSVEKRADLAIDVWAGQNKGGRHETLHTTLNKCYSLGNGWDNDIESLVVPKGFGCVFYNKGNCNKNSGDSGALRLTISAPAVAMYYSSLGDGGSGGMNNMISSYLCFRP